LTGELSTLLEWDASIPDFPTLHAELLKAKTQTEKPIPTQVVESVHEDALSNPIHFMVGGAS